MRTAPILGFPVAVQSFDEALERLEHWSQDWEQPRFVPFVAAYTLTTGKLDSEQRMALHQADMLPADGMPLVWLQRYFYQCQDAERLRASDALEWLCAKTAGTNISHYFWGGEPHITGKLVETLKHRFPGINIAGHYAPPFAPLETEVNPAVVERINLANPNIVWVCLGSVKQDKWMAMYRPYLKAPLLMGVGVSFYFVSGTKPQAPLWMQRIGLEWFFRLLTEPRRLAKRYIYYNLIFVGLILNEIISKGFRAWVKRKHGKRT